MPRLNGHGMRGSGLGWAGMLALGFGGVVQSLFLLDGLVSGQSGIPGQGAAAVLLLAAGFGLTALAAPGWLELVLMSPRRVGGIGAACGDAFRPYSPLLASMTGFCLWWGWAATNGLAATTIAAIALPALAPGLPLPAAAASILLAPACLTLFGLRPTRVAAALLAGAILVGIAVLLAGASGLAIPARLAHMPLTTPFPGRFGTLTACMSGLFLVGYGAPCIEGVLAYAGLARDPARSLPRTLWAALALGGLFFVVVPAVLFAALGASGLRDTLDNALAPVFRPVLGSQASAAAALLLCLSWLASMISGFSGAPLILAQLSADGMAPRILSFRNRRGAPAGAIALTALTGLAVVLIGDTVWLQGAANFAYLFGIFLPSLAVWLLRRNAPDEPRLYRAPRGLVTGGLVAGSVWLLTMILGAEQFGLPIVIAGLMMAYSGAVLLAWRKQDNRRRQGGRTLYVDVMASLAIVIGLNGIGYIVALRDMAPTAQAVTAALADLFSAVALFSLVVSVVLPGHIVHTARRISKDARVLARETLVDLSVALDALGAGALDRARLQTRMDALPVQSRTELGEVAASFNDIRTEIARAAHGLENARVRLAQARDELTATNDALRQQIAAQEILAGQLTMARNAAEAADRSKSNFLAMMSHELRTPLNGVIGMADVLLGRPLDGQSHLYAKMLRDAGDHLLDMINNVLDLTKLEAGRVEFETIPFDIHKLAHTVLELVTARGNAKGLELGEFVAPDIPRLLRGDPGRLRQVLINLLGNAVKFTETGHVLLELTCAAATERTCSIRFAVTDTGIGFDANAMPTLFEMFNQADTTISRKFGGSGLGLTISRHLVNAMGGAIKASSIPGVGSVFEFTVTLPRADCTHHDPVSLDDDRVLIAYHDPAGAALLARQITSRKGRPTIVHGFSEALDALQAGHYASCIVDQALGVAATRRFATNAREMSPATRLVLLSSSEFAPASNALNNFDCTLLKPVPLDTLIFRLKSDTPPDDASGVDAMKQEGLARPLSILLAEDNRTNQAVVSALLTRLNHRVHVAENGAQAVSIVEKGGIDLVLMDVMMPVMDGLVATAHIRRLPAPMCETPIVALTADAMTDLHHRSEGMFDAILIKPITLTQLESVVTQFGASRRSSAEIGSSLSRSVMG